MSNIISIAAVRGEKLKQALTIHSRQGDAVVIETRSRRVTAERINCRELFVEVLDGRGDYLVIDYNDIRALHAMAIAQTSVVNARGEFLPAHNPAAAAGPVAILPFLRRVRRK
ncbi:MAG: hypothetical protein ACO1NY_13430 [Pseudorhodoplanes sp.]